MIRHVTTALGLAGLLLCSSWALAEGTADDEAAPKKPAAVPTKTVTLKDKKTGHWVVIQKPDGKAHHIRVEPSESGWVTVSDAPPVRVVTTGNGKTFVLQDGKWVALKDEANKKSREEEEDDVDEELEEQIADAIRDGLRHLRPKARKIAKRLQGVIRELDDESWEALTDALADGLEGDVDVEIHRDDDKPKKGKGGKRFRLRGDRVPFLFRPGRGHGALGERLQRLEDENRRMKHELELMRRRLNEMSEHARTKGRPSVFLAPPTTPASNGPSANDGINRRLQRIEGMLRKLLDRAANQQARRLEAPRAGAALQRAKQDVQEQVAQAHRRAARQMAKAKAEKEAVRRAKASEQAQRQRLEEMIEASRARIAELMAEIERRRKEAEKAEK